jgi:anti-sigma regulatory factor (Ser/Thr protein kinase)
MRTNDVPREVVDDLLLAVTEIATNAIEASPVDRASVLGQTGAGRVQLAVSNEGRTFTGEHQPPPGAGLSERGRGLHIARSVVDTIAFDPVEGGTEVTFTKRF